MDIDNIKVYGLEESVVASGLPMVTQFYSDVFENDADAVETFLTDQTLNDDEENETAVKHLKRADRLASCAGGESHDCFLCGIIVQMTITAPRYWWQEFQRYHFIDIISSTSTMHRLKTAVGNCADKEDFERYFCESTYQHPVWEFFEFAKNALAKNPDCIELLKANLPEGWLQTARVTTNYRQLKTIYRQRHNHRLEEWRDFCDVLEQLPKSEWITGVKK